LTLDILFTIQAFTLNFFPIAAVKTTLALPKSPSPHKRFGAHKGQQDLGPIAVELRWLFDLISRAPLRFVFNKLGE